MKQTGDDGNCLTIFCLFHSIKLYFLLQKLTIIWLFLKH